MSEIDRWRLVLGRYARQRLGDPAGEDARRDAALEQLYGREYGGRGVRPGDGSGDEGGAAPASLAPGGQGASQPRLVDWLGEVRELFPRETVEVIERHALDRYGLVELVSDPDTLERLEPNESLLRTLLMLKGHLGEEVLVVARRIIRQVVDDLRRRLEMEVRRAMAGRLSQHRHAPVPVAANFDALGTLRRNLRNYDVERRRVVPREVLFFERNTRRLPWEVIICVDQSGSMAGSVIHSAVMAGILHGLPSFTVRLVVFDTAVVDLSDQLDDPVEVLMRVQLGGGTDIGGALRYCSQLIENPDRTVLVLVTDFCEGGSPARLEGVVAELASARVTLLGLAALDGEATPFYDRQVAGRLADRGMKIAALTPQHLAEWLVEVTS
ncbi:VWA containing CoxE family protein [Nocardioides aromaticivorans]|uniref:VWA containing CoxE family protein n=1 Tax=Nocardioides aromaticivorans TaxID=200618 RepID=A0ABX7PJJ0_9ACTN|nr:VWA domain-containing protein [Nocardioides aromaticivorans]QSR25868.1 VWA containing CoxE family protein [Nocardioides aromaticivorans]